jgi:hypothetical protein
MGIKKSSFATIVGNLKKIILCIYNQCKYSVSYEVIISIADIAASVQIPIGSVNTTLSRLEKYGHIQKIEYRAGRGGWKKIKINENLYREILIAETRHEPDTKPDTISSSSSSYITTTTTGNSQNLLPSALNDGWAKIDIDQLSNIGFTQTHLAQITSQNILTPELVQGSIYAFAFDLQENNKAKSIKGDPINFFMGILRSGKPYAPPSNYESPQDREMRIYLERMREIESKRIEIEKEAANLTFNDWFSRLEDNQKMELLPEPLRDTSINPKTSIIIRESAKSHFFAKVWPEKARGSC